MAMKILVVDDDQAVRDSLARSLRYSGYEVETAEDGVDALAKLSASRPDALVMDVMMPRLDGLETTKMLRANDNVVPILILTARDAVGDRVDGLDAGADDYMVKPFSLDELLARIRALTRRSHPDLDQVTDVMQFADLTLDPTERVVKRGDRVVNLTRTEFTLMQAFMMNPGKVLDRNKLLEEVWGKDLSANANALEVYIGYLRRKTEENGEPRLIYTVRGIGYVLREETK